MLHGAVVDFALLHITTASFAFNWYVFNLADVFISLGAVLVVLDEFLGWRREPKPSND